MSRSTYHVTDLRTIDPQTRTDQDDEKAFFECDSYRRFVFLMSAVIDSRMQAPQFLHETMDDLAFDRLQPGYLGEENAWWSSARGKLLAEINHSGLVTLQSQECNGTSFGEHVYQDNVADNCRCCLALVCPDRFAYPLMDFLRANHLLVFPMEPWRHKGERDPFKIMTRQSVDATGEETSWTRLEVSYDDRGETYSNGSWMEKDVLPFLNPAMKSYLQDECVEMEIVDPVYNRTFDDPHGILSVLIKFIQKTSIREEFGLVGD